MDILITNNPLVKTNFKERFQIEFVEGSLQDVLTVVRDRIHSGHTLLTHPLSGSIKPNETPFKSVLISAKKEGLDFKSVQIIEDSIITAKKFPYKKAEQKHLADYREIDFSLISSATSTGGLL